MQRRVLTGPGPWNANSLLLSRGFLLELSEKSFAVQEEFFPTVSHIQRSQFQEVEEVGPGNSICSLQGIGFPPSCSGEMLYMTPTAPDVPRGVASGSGSWWGGQETSSGCLWRPMVSDA